MRKRWTLALAPLLAACVATPPTSTGARRPAAEAASASAVQAPALRPQDTARPLAATLITWKGTAMAPPEWRANGGPILSNNGGSILSNNGGSGLATGGHLVAQGGGLISPGTGIPTGGKWLRPDGSPEAGSGLVANNGGALISPGTGIPTGGKWLRPEEPLDGHRIRAYTATGAVALGPSGKPLEATTDASGAFAFEEAPTQGGPFLLQGESKDGVQVVAALVGLPTADRIQLDVASTLALSYLTQVAMLGGGEGVSGVPAQVMVQAVNGLVTYFKDRVAQVPVPLTQAYIAQVLVEVEANFPETYEALIKLSDEVKTKGRLNHQRFVQPTCLATDHGGDLAVWDEGRTTLFHMKGDALRPVVQDEALHGVRQVVALPEGAWAFLMRAEGGDRIGHWSPQAGLRVLPNPPDQQVWASIASTKEWGLVVSDGVAALWRVDAQGQWQKWSTGWDRPVQLAAKAGGGLWVASGNPEVGELSSFDGSSKSPVGWLSWQFIGEPTQEVLPVVGVAQFPDANSPLIFGYPNRVARLLKPELWANKSSVAWSFMFGTAAPLLSRSETGGAMGRLLSLSTTTREGLFLLTEDRLVQVVPGLALVPIANFVPDFDISNPDGSPRN